MEKKKEGQERGEEKERKGIESLNGSGERKEALETTAAAVGGGVGKKWHLFTSEANQMKRTEECTLRGGARGKKALGA